jgi:hypothetical protein
MAVVGGEGTWKPCLLVLALLGGGTGVTLVVAGSGLLALVYCDQGSIMKPSNKEEVAGKIHEVKGAVK